MSGKSIVIDDDSDGTKDNGADQPIAGAGGIQRDVLILLWGRIADDFHRQRHMDFSRIEHECAVGCQVALGVFGGAVAGGIRSGIGLGQGGRRAAIPRNISGLDRCSLLRHWLARQADLPVAFDRTLAVRPKL